MSELQPLGVVVGLFISGFALFISVFAYRKQAPRLNIVPERAFHKYAVSKNQVRTISVYAFIQIDNRGDRPTRINKIVLMTKGKKFKVRTAIIENGVELSSKWIEAHDTANIITYSLTEIDSQEKEELSNKEKMDWTLLIHHTHATQEINLESTKRDDFTFLRDALDKLEQEHP
jgi:hypothetical protein